MPIEIKGIVCPQCGGTDVEMISESRGLCHSCETQFLIYRHAQEYEPASKSPGVIKQRIRTEYSKQEFLRRVWIDLNEADAPSEIFDSDFGEISSIQHQIVIEQASLEGSFQASVGHDRQEPYLVTETYWERVGDRNVRKERVVTKYRTVTDWQAHSGSIGMESAVCSENCPDIEFDEELFIDSFHSTGSDFAVDLSAAESNSLQISDYARHRLDAAHKLQFERNAYRNLPGDHCRDLNTYLAKKSIDYSAVYLAKEYRTSILLHGTEYVRYAFPFGAMVIGGQKIANENSMWNNVRKMHDTVPQTIWNRTRLLSLLTIGLLAISIIVNLFIHVTALTILFFAIGVGAFIWNTVDVNQKASAVQRETDAAVEKYQAQYRAWRLRLLNQKLESLGLAPVTRAKGDEDA